MTSRLNERWPPGTFPVLVLPDRRLVSIPEGVTLIGRRGRKDEVPRADVDLGRYDDERLVSRAHAELRFVDGYLSVRDLGSTNGTEVRGVAVPKDRDSPLRPGDELTAGDVRLRIARLDEGAHAEATPARAAPKAATGDPSTRSLPATGGAGGAPGREKPVPARTPPADSTIIVGGRRRVSPDEPTGKKGGALDRLFRRDGR